MLDAESVLGGQGRVARDLRSRKTEAARLAAKRTALIDRHGKPALGELVCGGHAGDTAAEHRDGLPPSAAALRARSHSWSRKGVCCHERRDDDTYAVALGDATRNGLTIGDISRVSIEKSRDGIAGGWYLHGVTLVVNGRTFMRDRSIDRWLEDSKRVWTAPNLTRDHRTGDVIPIWLQLREDDFGPQDTGDINVFDRNTSLPIAFRLGTTVRQTVTGACSCSLIESTIRPWSPSTCWPSQPWNG